MLKIRPNGDMIVDELITDVNVDGLKSIKTIKCPNLYGTAFEVWESQDLATIFGTGEVLEPEGITTFTALSGHNYYDTYTGEITAGTGDDVTITNTGVSAVTVYIVDLTTLFTTEPNETQMDDMTKMFLFNGTGSELITLQEVFYVDYVEQVIHNLTTIYGVGKEPTLETHETLIPQYTNTVLKAKAFADTLQQEYMQISLDTAIYEGLSLRDIFESEEISATGKNLFYLNDLDNFNQGSFLTVDGRQVYQGRGYNYTDYLEIKDVFKPLTQYTIKYDVKPNGAILNQSIRIIYTDETFSTSNIVITNTWTTISITSDSNKTISRIVQHNATNITAFGYIDLNTIQLEQGTVATTYENYLDLAMILETPSLYGTVDLVHWETGSLFTTAPSQAQLDEWLDMYLTLKGSTTNTGTEFYQDRYYVDYDNAKVYDYEVIEPYVPETPVDKEAFMAQVIAKTITLTAIPVKAKIYKDRFVILGSYTIIGE